MARSNSSVLPSSSASVTELMDKVFDLSLITRPNLRVEPRVLRVVHHLDELVDDSARGVTNVGALALELFKELHTRLPRRQSRRIETRPGGAVAAVCELAVDGSDEIDDPSGATRLDLYSTLVRMHAPERDDIGDRVVKSARHVVVRCLHIDFAEQLVQVAV